MLLCEYRVEIVWVYTGIVASSLFRVDVPSSRPGVGLGAQVARVETDGEVELTGIPTNRLGDE